MYRLSNHCFFTKDNLASVSSSYSPGLEFILESFQNYCDYQHHSQTLINFTKDFNNNSSLYRKIITNSNAPNLLNSFGPFRINLDNRGQPIPIFVAINQTLSASEDTVGKYTVVFRLDGSDGFTSPIQIGTFITSSSTSTAITQTKYWNHLTTSNISNSYNFIANSSVLATTYYTTEPTIFKSRLDKQFPQYSIPAFKNSQVGAMAYLDIYVEVTGSNHWVESTLWAVYAKELNGVVLSND